jgi:hypothetical protein
MSHWITRERPLTSAGEELAGLLGEVDENGAALEHGEVVGLAVDDRRDPRVGVDGAEPRLLLIALRQREGVERVGEGHLLEGDGDLVTVGGGCRVEVDHAARVYRGAARADSVSLTAGGR